MSAVDIERLRALEKAATPGAWRVRTKLDDTTSVVHVLYDDMVADDWGIVAGYEHQEMLVEDAALIVEMRNVLVPMLDEIERLRAGERVTQEWINHQQEVLMPSLLDANARLQAENERLKVFETRRAVCCVENEDENARLRDRLWETADFLEDAVHYGPDGPIAERWQAAIERARAALGKST